MAPRLTTPFHKTSRGASLLELLLVLSGIAVIVFMSVNRYQSYHQQIATLEIKNDVAVITGALNRYFYKIGCDAYGNFPSDKRKPSMTELGLDASHEARLPLITKYTAYVVDSGYETKNKKPIYTLQINAQINRKQSKQRLEWYQKIWNASAVNTKHNRLTWQSLPSTNTSGTKNPLWILAGSRKQFQKIETISDLDLNYHQCAE